MRAILTTKDANSVYFPLWERYYAPLFELVEVIPIDYQYGERAMDDFKAQRKAITEGLEYLLSIEYSPVVLADVDEFLVPDPEKYASFGDYLDRFDRDAACCVGYNVMEMPGDDRLSLDAPITDQRGYWVRDENYDKAVITTRPLKFCVGQHKASPEVQQDPDLYLFHLRDADIRRTLERRGSQNDPVAWNWFYQRRAQAEPIPEKWKVI